MSEPPPDRWDHKEWGSSTRQFFTVHISSLFKNGHIGRPDEPGKYNTSMCGFINAIDHFDTLEFGISMKEAQQLDPSSRLILEVAHLVRAVLYRIVLLSIYPIGSLRLWN